MSISSNKTIFEKEGHIHLDPKALRAEKNSDRGSLSSFSSDGSVRSVTVSPVSITPNGSQSPKKIVEIGIKVASVWDKLATILSFGYSKRATKVSFDGGHTFKWLKSTSLSKYFFEVFKTTHLVTTSNKQNLKDLQEHRTKSKGAYNLDEAVLQGFIKAARNNNPTIDNDDSTPTCIGNFLKVFVINVDATNQSKGRLPNLLDPIRKLEDDISDRLPDGLTAEDLDSRTRKNHLCCYANKVADAWAEFFQPFNIVQQTVQRPRRISATNLSTSTTSASSSDSDTSSTASSPEPQSASRISKVWQASKEVIKGIRNFDRQALFHSILLNVTA